MSSPAPTVPRLVIVGNGVTGITTARTVRKLLPSPEQVRITVISAESDYFWSRTALMYIYMGHMRAQDTEPYERHFYPRNHIELLRDRVTDIRPAAKELGLENGGTLSFDYLVLALGSVSNKFGWPGQDLEGVQGMYSLQDLDGIERASAAGIEHAAIVGGGLIGVELAEMFHTRHIPVSFLVREESYMDHAFPPEESAMITREILRHGVDLKLKTNLKEILDDGQGRARAVVTEAGEEIACQFVGLTAGVSPNVALVKDTEIETARGILVDGLLQTSAEGIFAAGDCAQFRDQAGFPGKIYPLWYTGKHQGKALGRILAERIAGREGAFDAAPWHPGVWFNSAKFFTIEWQTYGFVPNQLEADSTFIWVHPRDNKAIRLVWEKNGADTRVTGFNLMGVRYRHEVCERWIREERPVEYVVDRLADANFDPEFFARHEKDFQKAFRKAGPLARVS